MSFFNSNQISLEKQIHLRIIRLLIVILTFSSIIFIWQTRLSVQKETRASMSLASQLLKMMISQSAHQQLTDPAWLQPIYHLKPTRHFKIYLRQSTNTWLAIAPPITIDHLSPPLWFIRLMKTEDSPSMYSLITADGHSVHIRIEANSPDEITEAWHEIQTFMFMLIAFSIGLVIIIHLIFKQVLQAVSQILTGLMAIEQGNYQKLPSFASTELNQIAQAINQLMDSLQSSQQENRRLSLHSLTIQELERQHLSRELHDEFSQSLTAIKTLAITGQHTCAATQLPVILTTIIDIADQMFAAVRLMMKQLHPVILTELGLTASLQDLIQSWNRTLPQLTIELNIEGHIDDLDNTIAIHVFRIIQESITNTIRHAQAQQMMIQLTIINHQLQLVIQDNGIGHSQLKLGFGLLGMQSRVHSLNGQFHWFSAEHQGMQLKIQLPL